MKSDIDLLNLYKEEKTLVIGPEHLRTGLEPFPTFKEWKLEYMKEYVETHDMDNPVSMEEAVKQLEAELDEDDLLPEDDLKALVDEVGEVDEDDVEPVGEAPLEPVEMKPEVPTVRKRKVTKKSTTKKVAARKRPASKAKDAQKVFDRLYPKVLAGKKARKDVIDELVAKVGLTANGAATYYQKMKKAAS